MMQTNAYVINVWKNVPGRSRPGMAKWYFFVIYAEDRCGQWQETDKDTYRVRA